jgi:hypothetical protein
MPATKLDLRNVSLLCVETRYPALARYAIERCLAVADFKECILLSPTTFDLPDTIRQVRIAPITSVEAYSALMLNDLGRYFSGTHVLVIQWDSFIVDAGQWSDTYTDYDYIGALWPHRPPAVAVGNGGFSLRSRRLVDALRRIAIPVTHPEDAAIGEWHRAELSQRHGIRYAPAGLASRFAFECLIPAAPTFGFHGFFNFHRVLSDAELGHYIGLCDNATLRSEEARRLIRSLYHAGRYAMARRLLRRRLSGPPALAADAAGLWLRTWWHALTTRRAPAATPR